MKRIFLIFALCAFFVPQGMWAQENIDKMISASAEKASKKTHDSYQNDPRLKEVSSASDVYYFSDKKLFDGFKAAFDKDSGDAYYSDYDENSGKRIILMGKIKIGKDYDSHYVLCFPDENLDYRYGYALEWNKKWNGFRVVKVHGERPGKDFSSVVIVGLDSLRNINWKWISDSVARELQAIDWKGISDSVAQNLKGINWRGINDSVCRALNGIDWHYLSDSVSSEISKEMKEFSKSMEKFRKGFSGRRSTSDKDYLKVIPFEPTWGEKLDKLLKSSSPKNTEEISKIYDLCKNRPADLSESDREAYIASIKDLLKRTDDRLQKKMLSSSIKFLK
ncbi:MAG: hypothetical protein PUK70_00425 [Bacteroidales bacterium]|nr:hypothetical protein [Bacteroidales bacterium]MDY6002271.1 hypothetical protein [Candidatus Cryptobacteroides sp.]